MMVKVLSVTPGARRDTFDVQYERGGEIAVVPLPAETPGLDDARRGEVVDIFAGRGGLRVRWVPPER